MFTPPNKSFRGQKLKQPMGELFVTMFDISGGMGRCGVTVVQEIIIHPFIVHMTNASRGVQCFINTARISKE